MVALWITPGCAFQGFTSSCCNSTYTAWNYHLLPAVILYISLVGLFPVKSESLQQVSV